MTVQAVRVSPAWLRLREPADAAARASDLVEPIRMRLPERGRAVIHDLGCGTGSMGRWLAPRLAGSQHWVLYDRDADLLAHAREDHRVVPLTGPRSPGRRGSATSPACARAISPARAWSPRRRCSTCSPQTSWSGSLRPVPRRAAPCC